MIIRGSPESSASASCRAGDAHLFGVPGHAQLRRVVRRTVGRQHLRAHGGNRAHLFADGAQPTFPLLPFGVVIALGPGFHRGQHPHDLFLADLQRTAESMMRRAVDPGRLQQVFPAEQQSRALRAAQAFAAAIGHHVGAALQIHVGNGETLGGRVHDHRDVPACAPLPSFPSSGMGCSRQRLRRASRPSRCAAQCREKLLAASWA